MCTPLDIGFGFIVEPVEDDSVGIGLFVSVEVVPLVGLDAVVVGADDVHVFTLVLRDCFSEGSVSEPIVSMLK